MWSSQTTVRQNKSTVSAKSILRSELPASSGSELSAENIAIYKPARESVLPSNRQAASHAKKIELLKLT